MGKYIKQKLEIAKRAGELNAEIEFINNLADEVLNPPKPEQYDKEFREKLLLWLNSHIYVREIEINDLIKIMQ